MSASDKSIDIPIDHPNQKGLVEDGRKELVQERVGSRKSWFKTELVEDVLQDSLQDLRVA